MPAKGDRKKSKIITRSDDLVPRSAPHPIMQMPAENVTLGPSVPELSLMINGKPRPAIHLLQMPGESGFMARAPPSSVTPRLSARAIEKVSSARIVTEDEGAVGGIVSHQEADAMLFFKQFNGQFGEMNGVDSNVSTVKLDKFKGSNPKKNRERVRAAIVATTMSPSSAMPPPPIPTPHCEQPKAEPSVPELSVLENILAKNSGAMKKVTFEEFSERHKHQPIFVEQQHKQKPRRFSKCDRIFMENQLEEYERRITELEMKLTTARKLHATRERGVKAPIVRDKSTQVTPEIFDPPKNSKKSKKRGDRNPMDNLKIIIPNPIPKPSPKPITEPADTHDPSTDVITQEKLLKALAQINCIFSASRQTEPGTMSASNKGADGCVSGAGAKTNGATPKGATAKGPAATSVDKGSIEKIFNAKGESIQKGATAKGPPPAAKETNANGPPPGATAKGLPTDKGATAKGATAKETGAKVVTLDSGNRSHAIAAEVVRAAYLRATSANPVIESSDRSELMKQLAAKYLPEWQQTLYPDDEKENGSEENNQQLLPGTPSRDPKPTTTTSSSAVENLRNYNEFPFDSTDEHDSDVKRFDSDVIPFAMSPEEKSLLLTFRQRKIVMTDDQINTK